jgi:hypothetical protein
MHQELERFECVPQGSGKDVYPNNEANKGCSEVGSADSSLKVKKPSIWLGADSYIMKATDT